MDGGAWWATVHGVAESRARLSDFTFTFHFHALEREMATHSSVLAWRIPGMAEPGGLPSMGSHGVRHNWSDLAAAAAAGDSPKFGNYWLKVFVLNMKRTPERRRLVDFSSKPPFSMIYNSLMSSGRNCPNRFYAFDTYRSLFEKEKCGFDLTEQQPQEHPAGLHQHHISPCPGRTNSGMIF